MARSGVLKQYLAAITCNLLTAGYGSSCAWAGPNFMLLTSPETPLKSGPLSTTEGSLVVSLPCFGSIIGTLVYTLCIDRCSRKFLLNSIAIPQLLCWVVLLLAQSVYHLYAARLVSGFVGAGIMVTVPVFVGEISDSNIRGTLNSMLVLASNAGFLAGITCASFLDYFDQIKINMILPIVFLAAISYLIEESPEYLLKRNQADAAEKARNFYKGIKGKPSVEMKSMDQQEKSYEMIENEDTSLSLSDFCNPAAKKATLIALSLGALNQFCGAFAMLSYTVSIFEEAGSSLSSNNASIVVAIALLSANCLTMILVDKAGRKILICISAIGTAFGLIFMGLYDLFKVQLEDHKWIPILSFSTIILMASIGMLPLTYVIMSEILPRKIKNVVTLLSLEVMWILAFVLLSFYPMMTATLGTYNCMFIFAGCCIFGAIFYLICLPETKGKSYDEIMAALEK